ncbi:MAG: Gx transporter family protein [Firmicutes bacterium]|nr:Gx transporter family protein [Bacillota bacterium]
MSMKKLIFLALLVAIGLVLSIVESFIPIPFVVPGVKLGLANIIGLVSLVIFGYKEALIVVILRSLTFALSTGNFSGLFYSLSGAILSVTVMFIVYKFLSRYFSLIGVSIFGAISHSFAQIAVASLIIENIRIFSYLPIMMLMSLFSGYFVGLSSIYLTKNLKNKNMSFNFTNL